MSDFYKDDERDEQDPDFKSRTQVKREMQALQDLGRKLVELSNNQLAQIPLDETLGHAISEARRINSREGLRRQLQYVGKLMRSSDHEAIAAAYQKLFDHDKQHIQKQHKLERWRDRLIAEGDSAINEFVGQFPAADRQQLRQLVRSAKKEQENNKPPASARKLFRCLREHAGND